MLFSNYFIRKRKISILFKVSLSPGGLDNVLGNMSLNNENMVADLSEQVISMEDMPEYLILECILKMLEADVTEERKTEVLRTLVLHDVSHPVLSQMMTEKLNLEQVIRSFLLLQCQAK